VRCDSTRNQWVTISEAYEMQQRVEKLGDY
jgi:hypothetical protein